MKFGTVAQIGPLHETDGENFISNFSKNKTVAAAILKVTKIAISPQPFDRFLLKFGTLTQNGFLIRSDC